MYEQGCPCLYCKYMVVCLKLYIVVAGWRVHEWITVRIQFAHVQIFVLCLFGRPKEHLAQRHSRLGTLNYTQIH